MPNKLTPLTSLIMMIDIQDKLVKMVQTESIIHKNQIIATISKELELPVILTEQYPQGLGDTIDEVKSKLHENTRIYEKKCFSALEEENLCNTIKDYKRTQIILSGIETHICVLQTALDLLENGYQVFILKDACASRNKEEHNLALERLKQNGAIIISTEMFLFELLKKSSHPKFKELQKLIK